MGIGVVSVLRCLILVVIVFSSFVVRFMFRLLCMMMCCIVICFRLVGIGYVGMS